MELGSYCAKCVLCTAVHHVAALYNSLKLQLVRGRSAPSQPAGKTRRFDPGVLRTRGPGSADGACLSWSAKQGRWEDVIDEESTWLSTALWRLGKATLRGEETQ